MAKRIRDSRKRKTSNIGRDNREKNYIHLGLVKAFPDIKDRLQYIRAIIKDLSKPNDPRLVNGESPEVVYISHSL